MIDPVRLMRAPDEIMRLDRLGAAFPTRLSFMRVLVRRMAREQWQFSKPLDTLDENGFGHVVYTVNTGSRCYSLVAFSHDLDPGQRSDRVIADAWDATFNLFDGIPDNEDILRLARNTPRQEAGRFSQDELVLARANKSERLFNHVVDALTAGQQPDLAQVIKAGYLMRTTAVYGSGKFGCADRNKIAGREEINGSFQVEMLTVYLIRLFAIDLAEHIARARNPGASQLAPELRRLIGIGNATGLGMAPFLVNHQVLLHKWVYAKELALARIRSIVSFPPSIAADLNLTLRQAQLHIRHWQVDDSEQKQRINELQGDLLELITRLPDLLTQPQPGNAIFSWVDENLGLEARELIISVLLECNADQVDDLGEDMLAELDDAWDPAMTVKEVAMRLDSLYPWITGIDPDLPETSHRVWYYSAEKLEPRLGTRAKNPDLMAEMPLAIGRDLATLKKQLNTQSDEQTMLQFCAAHPALRHVVKRVQTSSQFPYSEIADNLLGEGFRPIDLLRFKLAYFGATAFDPKSALWTRVTMYQGAPLPDQLNTRNADNWAFPLAEVTTS